MYNKFYSIIKLSNFIDKEDVILENKITVCGTQQEITKQEKVISLFKFIEELNKLKQKVIINVSAHPWWCAVSSFPNDPENIKINYRDRTINDEENEEQNTADILLSVHKPEFQKCPDVSLKLKNWLEWGWHDYRYKVRIKDFILHPLDPEQLSATVNDRIDTENLTYKEFFTDDKDRVSEFQTWNLKRNEWVERQKILEKTRDFFSDLYKISIDLERDSETLEFVAADGFIRDRNTPQLDHPILTRRVKIHHDPEKNTIYIADTDVETELYTVMFQTMENINLSAVNHMMDDLHRNDYHPMDRNELPAFLKIFIHQLSSESIYVDNEIPNDWQKKDHLLMYRNPCYILRRRIDGTLKAIEQIIDHIEETGEVPAPIGDIVEGGKIDISEDAEEITVEEQLASVGGESKDILLSKEANKEQLEIARRIERFNAVLVQGPPGTGKTHTIANLMGHFLAQGKSVLVTSHTQKALSVLKEKIVPGLQSLCVSVLDDSNADMEKSIDGITSYMSKYTSFEIKKELEFLKLEREQIIRSLADTRKNLYAIINQECNCIVYNGESISPSSAAKFVRENHENLSYIPGKVRFYEPLPLTFDELSELYRSNCIISMQDESELDHDIPNPENILSPENFENNLNSLELKTTHIKNISELNNYTIQNLPTEKRILISADFGQLTLDYPKPESVNQLKNYVSTFPDVEPWMFFCAVDGRKGDAHKQLWMQLIRQIQDTSAYAEKLTVEKFGKDVKILNHDSNFADTVKLLMDKYSKGEKINKLTLLFNKNLETALNGAAINDQQPQTAEDCMLILHIIETESMRDKCALYWNDLIAKHGVPEFYNLDSEEPERIALKYIPYIQFYLNWFETEYETLISLMHASGLPCNIIFQNNTLDSEIKSTEKIFTAIRDTIPKICDIFETVKLIADIQYKLDQNCINFQTGKRINSEICKTLLSSAKAYDPDTYRKAFANLEETYAKTQLKNNRRNYLDRISETAPQWADAIKNRDGIHGKSTVPSDINDAWKWKQYCGILEQIIEKPFGDLQKSSIELSKSYRKITAEYAEKSAWYNLLQRTEHDISMKQALIGWKQTIKKIGKGTGKNAPMYRAKARELMAKCQDAVPGWIMPINKALESLNPRTNQFDIIIIDEASQSDISSLAILYMGKKLIIVGDDKQVSPMAVGVQIDKINTLKEMYIADKIPNAHLYDAKTSIYDIAATTFQPLMLREHFRCVPEIIGFSNRLSYDNKIKPLRDCSNSTLLPAVVNYRVKDGERIEKTNPNEAKAIIALIQACMEQPEYTDKTFGIISLLGDEQVKKLQEEIYLHITPKEISKHKILCGNASNFQGDERDVVFLSVVDCANGNGPLSKMTFGVDDAYRKRYNVAASRARDQLWVVDSIDPANDLKPEDIRKMLIDYSINPNAFEIIDSEIESNSESPFESAVARFLTVKGYHLVQQWKVGAYRLDMVVVCGKKKIAVECDGERWHSGESKIREDMERQTILERLGWQFIRIRGSEYYSNPDKTMERVISELNNNGITPEQFISNQDSNNRETELLQRIKKRAHEIIYQIKDENSELNNNIVSVALNPKNDIIGTEIKRTKELNIYETTQQPTATVSDKKDKSAAVKKK